MGRRTRTLAALLGVIFVVGSNLPASAGSDEAWNREETAVIQASPRGFLDDPYRPVKVEPSGPVNVATTARPNIVVLMLDDIPAMDSRVWERMPTLDPFFLGEGLTFTRYFGNDPLCCPGRASFLTGLYTDHHGVWTNDARLFDPTESLATELQASGYTTMISGKYLNYTDRLARKRPPGWTYASIYGGGYYNYSLYRQGRAEYHDNDRNDYAPDVFSNEMIQQMRNSPPDKPIFAYAAPFVAHAGVDANGTHQPGIPIAAPRFKNSARCAGLPAWQPPNYNEADVSDKPAYIQARGMVPYAAGWPLQRLCESMLAADQEFARIRRELVAEGRFNNTLFLLTSDNGMSYGSHRVGTKFVPYSTQMPLFAFWADGRGLNPATSDAYLSNVDVAPTLCELAGCRMGPYPGGRGHPDGTSFLGLLTSASSSLPRHDALYEENRGITEGWPSWRALRTTPSASSDTSTSSNVRGEWHYIENDDPNASDPHAVELYDTSGGACWNWSAGMQGDPCELTNLAQDRQYAPLVALLHARLQRFVTDVDPRVP